VCSVPGGRPVGWVRHICRATGSPEWPPAANQARTIYPSARADGGYRASVCHLAAVDLLSFARRVFCDGFRAPRNALVAPATRRFVMSIG